MRPRTPFSTPFLLVALVGLVLLTGRILLPYATPIGWACILAAVFHPAYRLLLRSMPRRPSAAAAIVTAGVFALAVIPALLLTGVVASEALTAYERAAGFITENRVRVLDDLGRHWLVAPVWKWVRDRLAGGDVEPTSLALSGLRWVSEFAAANAALVAKNVLGFVVGLGILAFTLFFALRDGVALVTYLEESLPMDADDRRSIIHRLQGTLLAVVQGLAITALVQAMLLGLALWAIGIPFVMLLSVAAFGLAFLPVGAALVWLPIALGLFAGGEIVRATALLAWGSLVVGSADNLLRPLLIGGQTNIPTPFLFLGILGGLEAFGVIGLFAGPAAIAALLSIVTIYRERLLALYDPPVEIE